MKRYPIEVRVVSSSGISYEASARLTGTTIVTRAGLRFDLTTGKEIGNSQGKVTWTIEAGSLDKVKADV